MSELESRVQTVSRGLKYRDLSLGCRVQGVGYRV
jgi:hypothetical protein